MYLVRTQVGHPTLEAWKYPLPGDQHVAMIERVIIDVDARKIVRLQMPPDQHRSTLCDDIACRGGDWADVQWSPDSTHVAFVSTSRDHRQENLRVADAATGEVRDVLEEKVATYFESGNGRGELALPAGVERGDLVLRARQLGTAVPVRPADRPAEEPDHDAATATSRSSCASTRRTRMLYFLAVGREKGRDPYFSHFYEIGFDGGNLQLLTPEDADARRDALRLGKYFVDSYSKPDEPPVAVLRDSDGKLADDAREGGHLQAAGDRLAAADADRGEGA